MPTEPNPFRSLITVDLIRRLDQNGLPALVRRLARQELRVHGIPLAALHVASRVNIADDGEDGRLEWANGPEHTSFVPWRFTVFQLKAANISPANCRDEMIDKQKRLRPAIAEVLERGGAYVLVCSHDLGGQKIRARLKAMHEAIRAAGADPGRARKIDIYDAEKLKEWIGSHPSIAASLVDLSGYQTLAARRAEDHGLQTRYFPGSEKRVQLVTPTGKLEDVGVAEAIERCRNILAEPRQCVRIVGPSGVGKTRLILEALQGDDSEAADTLADAVLFASHNEVAQSLLQDCRRLKNEGADLVLVVDECPADSNRDLVTIVRGNDSRLRLVTLDHGHQRGETRSVELRLRPTDEGTTKEIATTHAPDLKGIWLDRLVSFAGGFPLLMVRAAERWREMADLPATLTDEELIRRIVFGRGDANEAAENALGTLALLRFLDLDHASELERAATLSGLQTSAALFRELAEPKRTHVVERHGRFAQLRPQPIAHHFAKLALGRVQPGPFLARLASSEAGELRRRVFRTIAEIGEDAVAKNLAARALDPTQFADLARADPDLDFLTQLVLIHPRTVLARIEDMVRSSELPPIGLRARQNLVECLSEAVVPRDLFRRVAAILLDLAVEELEGNQGNGARSLFCQLFRLKLSGTMAEPGLRWAFLESTLTSGSEPEKELCLAALDTSLEAFRFSRSSRASEMLHGHAAADWRPQTQEQIAAFFERGLRLLSDVVLTEPNLRAKALSHLGTRLRGILRHVPVGTVGTVLSDLRDSVGFSADLLNGVTSYLRFEAKNADDEIVSRVRSLHTTLLPTSLEDRLTYLVGSSITGLVGPDRTIDDGRDKDPPGEYALGLIRSLAGDCAADAERCQLALELVAAHGGESVVPFVHELSKAHRDRAKFLDVVVGIASRASTSDLGADMTRVALQGLADNDVRAAEDWLARAPLDPSLASLVSYLPYLLGVAPITSQKLGELAQRVRQDAVPVEQCRVLQLGRQLDNVSPESIVDLAQALSAKSKDGVSVAIEIVHMYYVGRRKLDGELAAWIKDLLRAIGLLADLDRNSSAAHGLVELIKAYFGGDHASVDAGSVTVDSIVRAIRETDDIWRAEETLREILQIVGDKFPRQAGEPVAEASLATDEEFLERLNQLVRPEDDRPDAWGALGELPIDWLVAWAKSHPSTGPESVLQFVPIFACEPDATDRFSTLVDGLVAGLDGRPDLLGALADRLTPMGWSGSLVPHIDRALEALTAWRHHELPRVRTWTEEQIGALERRREWETKAEGEREQAVRLGMR